MKTLTTQAVQELMALDSAVKLEQWIAKFVGAEFLRNESNWRLVGDQRSNAGSIEQSADDLNPLVERIVNGIEAVIELKRAETGIEPDSAFDAISKFFAVPKGRASELDESTARSLAQFVTVSLRGRYRDPLPTIEVRDFGIGVHPADLKDTLLALGQSDKGQKRYLIGMYGQGGSSTFDKCQYTVVISRQHPNLLPEGRSDQVGWTIVRKHLNVRSSVYTYLVDPGTNDVPRFDGRLGDRVGLENGTFIAHIGYKNLGGFASQRITNNAYFTLNYRLFDPLLPWTLIDSREGSPNDRRTMRGVPYRINNLPIVDGIGSSDLQRSGDVAVRHHGMYSHGGIGGSALRVEWWVLQDEATESGRRRSEHTRRLDQYRDRTRRMGQRVIAVTRGGQTHAALAARAIFRRKGLPQVARSVIVQVDTDDLTFEEGASFFASNRADLKTASRDRIEEAINSAIDLQIDDLRAIERERQEELVAGRGASDEHEIRKHLDPIIEAFNRTRSAPGSSRTDSGRQRQFRGLQTPTFLKFARTSPLRVRPGIPTRVELLTDAADEVVLHPRTKLRVGSTSDGIQYGSISGAAGRYSVPLIPSAELPVGTHIELSATIERETNWFLKSDQPRELIVESGPAPYQGLERPTHLRFRSQNGVIRIRRGGAKITLECDAVDTLIQDGAVLEVFSPDPARLPVTGRSGPRKGEFKINVNIPDEFPLGPAGEIIAALTLPDGERFEDIAGLTIYERLQQIGTADAAMYPNYDIKNVRRIPNDDDEYGWSKMPEVLDGSDRWTGQDVGAYLKSGSENEQSITFFLNVDNHELVNIERQLARRITQSDLAAFRTMHRTLLCFHLYRHATSIPTNEEGDYTYKDEMIRVNQTLIFTRNQFMDSLEAGYEGD